VAALSAALGAQLMALDDGSRGGAGGGLPGARVNVRGFRAGALGGGSAEERSGLLCIQERVQTTPDFTSSPVSPHYPRKNQPAPPNEQTFKERALTLPMREVDGEVWRSLLLALLDALERVAAAVRGA
jgi:hypothetical protein